MIDQSMIPYILNLNNLGMEDMGPERAIPVSDPPAID
jgi:hypothetical protein